MTISNWKRKRVLSPEVLSAMIPADRLSVWDVIGEYHPPDMARELQIVLGVDSSAYEVLFMDCKQPYKEENLD